MVKARGLYVTLAWFGSVSGRDTRTDRRTDGRTDRITGYSTTCVLSRVKMFFSGPESDSDMWRPGQLSVVEAPYLGIQKISRQQEDILTIVHV